MKKLFTLIALIGFAFGANAQRHCDLQVTQTSPVNGSTIKAGDTVQVSEVLTNLGTDQIKTSDSIEYAFLVGGRFLKFGAAGDSVFYFPCPKNLNTGDTLQFNTRIIYSYSGVSSPSVNSFWCFIAIPFNGSSDSLRDNTLTNNESCDSLTFLDVHSVNSLTAGVNVYPNPAQSQVNFDVTLNAAANVAIRVTDMIGREVINESKGRLDAGQHILPLNTSNLQNGMYIYQVIVGTETKTGKIYISK